jgi:hypothetical protein
MHHDTDTAFGAVGFLDVFGDYLVDGVTHVAFHVVLSFLACGAVLSFPRRCFEFHINRHFEACDIRHVTVLMRLR